MPRLRSVTVFAFATCSVAVLHAGCGSSNNNSGFSQGPPDATSDGTGGEGGDDGGPGDSSLFGDGGGTCSGAGGCDGGVCISGKCCAGPNVCGSACCASGSVCLFDACVKPGAAFHTRHQGPTG